MSVAGPPSPDESGPPESSVEKANTPIRDPDEQKEGTGFGSGESGDFPAPPVNTFHDGAGPDVSPAGTEPRPPAVMPPVAAPAPSKNKGGRPSREERRRRVLEDMQSVDLLIAENALKIARDPKASASVRVQALQTLAQVKERLEKSGGPKEVAALDAIRIQRAVEYFVANRETFHPLPIDAELFGEGELEGIAKLRAEIEERGLGKVPEEQRPPRPIVRLAPVPEPPPLPKPEPRTIRNPLADETGAEHLSKVRRRGKEKSWERDL